MELAFDSRDLRTICESETDATAQFGPDVAKKLRNRLADLSAALSVDDLVAGRPRPVEGSLEVMQLDLGNETSLIFEANHQKNPVNQDGAIDWPRVRRLKIMRIE